MGWMPDLAMATLAAGRRRPTTDGPPVRRHPASRRLSPTSYPTELCLTPGTARYRLSRQQVIACAVVAAVLALSAVLGAGLVHGRAAASDRVPASPAGLGLFAVPGWTATQHALTVGPVRRSYLVARPLRATRARLPVLVLLHGRGMLPASVAERSGMLGDRPAIVVLPAGYGRSWNAGACARRPVPGTSTTSPSSAGSSPGFCATSRAPIPARCTWPGSATAAGWPTGWPASAPTCSPRSPPSRPCPPTRAPRSDCACPCSSSRRRSDPLLRIDPAGAAQADGGIPGAVRPGRRRRRGRR